MDTPLRKIRLERGLTLTEVSRATDIDEGNLSRLERNAQRASPDKAEILSKFYEGGISELEIIYPERFMGKEPPVAGDDGHDGSRDGEKVIVE